jgi:hypothetical protein
VRVRHCKACNCVAVRQESIEEIIFITLARITTVFKKLRVGEKVPSSYQRRLLSHTTSLVGGRPAQRARIRLYSLFNSQNSRHPLSHNFAK